MDDRALGSRVARLESLFARLEERIEADRDQRKDWRDEVARRLGELNNHYGQIIAERDHFLSKDTYEAQHGSLERLLESRSRDLARDNKEVLDVLDRKLTQHEFTDNENHNRHQAAIEQITSWVNNQKGRQWALGVLAAALGAIAGLLVQVLVHFFSKGGSL